MEEILTPSRSRLILDLGDQLTPSVPPVQIEPQQDIIIKDHDDVLKILQSQPDAENLTKCLQWLVSTRKESAFDIRQASPKAAQIIHVLVNAIVTDYWRSWKDSDSPDNRKTYRLLLRCLTSIAGIGAILTRLRASISDVAESQNEEKSDPKLSLEMLNLLGDLLEEDGVLDGIWNKIYQSSASPTQKQLVWKELIALVAAGRVLSIAAEVSGRQRTSSMDISESSWVTNGPVYAEWLGRSIRVMALQHEQQPPEKKKATFQLFSKSLTLGYTGC